MVSDDYLHRDRYQTIRNALPIPERWRQRDMTPLRARARIDWSRDGVEWVDVWVDAYRDDGAAWLCHLRDTRPWIASAWLATSDIEWAWDT